MKQDLKKVPRKLLHFFIIVCTVDVISHAPAEIRCNHTNYLKRGLRGVVLCDFDTSFAVLRWYREGESVPVARLEGKQTFASAGYDVTEKGNLIIENVQLEHDGRYTISGLSLNGNSIDRSTSIYVTVPMDTEPLIEKCSSSSSEICTTIKERMKGNTLVCSAGETRPAMEMQWYQMSQSGLETVKNIISSDTLNANTSLYTSSSTFQYNDESITLQQYDCKARGVAVETPIHSSILLEGTGPSKKVEFNINVQKGSSMQIECSREHFILYRWKVTYPNATYFYLSQIFPEEKGHCQVWSKCRLFKNGTLEIKDISHEDDGEYECLSTSLTDSNREINHLTVVTPPVPAIPVIRQCGEESDCRIRVSYGGYLQCTISNARPRVTLSWISDESDEIFLYNEVIDYKEDKKDGTVDTITTVEYKIEDCSSNIHLWCTSVADLFHEKYSSAEVILITDTSKCNSRGRPGLIVFFVLIIIALLAGCVIVVRKGDNVSNLLQSVWRRDGPSSPETVAPGPSAEVAAEEDEQRKPLMNMNIPGKLEDTSKYEEKLSGMLQIKELLAKVFELFDKDESKRDPAEIKFLREKVQKIRKTFITFKGVLVKEYQNKEGEDSHIIEVLQYIEEELLQVKGETQSSD